MTGAEFTRAVDGGRDPDQVACDAVVLATGGFDWSDDLRAEHLRVPVRAYGSPPTNEGDAVALARRVGAALEAMEHGWMMPMVQVPGEALGGRPFFRSLVTERGIRARSC